ncbi:hypothetical protein CORC01_04003 [Colletotrichum orchidophilum]|uniref:Haloacid dehalogenase-like hydrolase n=1 Tax=Colletotrichum orchidophilum TaxID=1209926 RepID=A0A1G4BH74_9PEZI|nr:uncharacterized protein CORC01_04003 [Colletotrichum orchidophilum]OHF00686.1 hypothetical protein CORC01_04003 [Colletotrichum orchidophilum]
MESIPHKSSAVLFDLDNTLFDHCHSLRSAIPSIQASYDSFETHNSQDLISKYNKSLQKAYDEYLRNEITYEVADFKKVRLFFGEIGLSEPDHKQIIEFRNIYNSSYRNHRRATPDSVEMLIRLRENGFRLVLVTNGQLKDQLEKAEAIGVRHLADKIITSEEAGCCKPDTKMFRLAIERLGASPQKSYIIGDSVNSDIKGGLKSGLDAILYSPIATDSTRELFGTAVPVIHSMSQLPEHLNFSLPRFAPRIYSQHSQVIVEGIGMDVVTEPRHCLWLTKDTVNSLSRQIAGVFEDISKENYISAISRLEAMIKKVAKAASPIDETAIQISYPGQDHQLSESITDFPFHITERLHSVRVDYEKYVFASKLTIQAHLRECIELLQSYCDNLMRDHPRAALRNLRSVMLILAKVAGIQTSTVVKGEGLSLNTI